MHDFLKLPFSISSAQLNLSLHLLPAMELVKPLYQLAKNPKVSEFMEWDFHLSESDTVNFMNFCELDFQKGNALHFAIKENDITVGIISLLNIHEHQAEITTWLGQEFWGQKLGQLAKQLLCTFAYQELAIKEIIFNIAINNQKSIIAQQKLNSTKQQIKEKAYLINDKTVDCIEYKLNLENFIGRIGLIEYRKKDD